MCGLIAKCAVLIVLIHIFRVSVDVPARASAAWRWVCRARRRLS